MKKKERLPRPPLNQWRTRNDNLFCHSCPCLLPAGINSSRNLKKWIPDYWPREWQRERGVMER